MNYQDIFDITPSNKFRTHTEETKKIIGEAGRCRQADPKVKAEISARSKETCNRPEVKAKISATHKGKVNSPETRAKLTGRKRSEETKEKMRIKAREREALKRANGFAVSEETKAKIRLAGQKKARHIITPAGEFASAKKCAEHYGVTDSLIYHWIKTVKKQGFYFKET